MRAFKRLGKRGFTLVELMIVVAIIGVLAALAIYGVRRYLATAKTGEAKNTIGAITRAAVAAYERETTPNEILSDGATSAQTVHSFCGSSSKVPASGTPPAAKKYQPSTKDGEDFNTGDNLNGWKCLKFNLNEATYFMYQYTKDSAPLSGLSINSNGFEVGAQGDLDGNSTKSTFARGATLRNGVPVVSTEMYIDKEYE